MEKEQELINKNLDMIYKSKFSFSKYELVDLNGKTSHGGFVRDMIIILNSYNLIIENGHYIMLSPLGKKVMTKYESWTNYLNKKSGKEEKEEVRQNKKDFILNINSKWIIPKVIIGILSFSALIFFGVKGLSLKKNKEHKQSQPVSIETYKTKKELTKEEEPQAQLKDTLGFQKK